MRGELKVGLMAILVVAGRLQPYGWYADSGCPERTSVSGWEVEHSTVSTVTPGAADRDLEDFTANIPDERS